MYSSNQTQQPMYGNGMPSSSYHWEHQLRVSSHHDRITVSSHPSDPHWYADSVLCPPPPPLSNQKIKCDNNNNGSPIGNKALNSQQLLFPPTVQQHHGVGPRAVIPSKRAAQNRAAQRAFRQRKERYVKDLEKKAKLMDEWKIEMEQLRQQNKELKENQLKLEKQIHQQQKKFNENDKPISPLTSPAMSVEVVPPPVVVVMKNTNTTTARSNSSNTNNKRRKIKQESTTPSPSMPKIHTTFLPVNLRAPDQTGFGSPTTSCSSSSSVTGLEEPQYHQAGLAWNTPTGAQFDTYNFMSHEAGGQVLDELCSVLQTRQRPEINYHYAMQHHQENDYSISPIERQQHREESLFFSRTQ